MALAVLASTATRARVSASYLGSLVYTRTRMPAAALTPGGEGDGSCWLLAHQPISLAESRKSLRPRARRDCHHGSRPARQRLSRVRGGRRNLNPAPQGLRGVRACAVGTRPETTRAGPVAQLTRVNATFMATGGRQDACAWGKSCSRSSM